MLTEAEGRQLIERTLALSRADDVQVTLQATRAAHLAAGGGAGGRQPLYGCQ